MAQGTNAPRRLDRLHQEERTSAAHISPFLQSRIRRRAAALRFGAGVLAGERCAPF